MASSSRSILPRTVVSLLLLLLLVLFLATTANAAASSSSANAGAGAGRPHQHQRHPHSHQHPQQQQQQQRSLQRDVPATIYLEQQYDAQQVLLLQTLDDGMSSKVLDGPCGPDTFYVTSAVVLGVNRTVDTDATAIGAYNEGDVMNMCRGVYFETYEKDWLNDGVYCDEEPEDPGRLDEGWCGYVYLTPGVEAGDAYVLAAGVRSFVEVDRGVCEGLMVQCEDEEEDDSGGTGDASGSGDDNGGGVESETGGETTTSSAAWGAAAYSLGHSLVAIALLSVATSAWCII